jgi:hypothetical protein
MALARRKRRKSGGRRALAAQRKSTPGAAGYSAVSVGPYVLGCLGVAAGCCSLRGIFGGSAGEEIPALARRSAASCNAVLVAKHAAVSLCMRRLCGVLAGWRSCLRRISAGCCEMLLAGAMAATAGGVRRHRRCWRRGVAVSAYLVAPAKL